MVFNSLLLPKRKKNPLPSQGREIHSRSNHRINLLTNCCTAGDTSKQPGKPLFSTMKKVILLLIIFNATVSMAQDLPIQGKIKFLALGDSYTIGESVLQQERWPVQLVDAFRKRQVECLDPRIIATTGWRTDELKSAINADGLTNDYTLVSLLIGVNNQYQGKSAGSYAPEFRELLEMAIELAGNDRSRVFVVSIPDYGYTPFGKANQPAISQGIDAFNEVNRSIAEKLGVRYFNITDISRKGFDDPDLVASDGLHPSGKMYAQWVDLILKGSTIGSKKE
jgi:lysophospholipase L1-like esterase